MNDEPHSPAPAITLKHIAACAGVAVSTVSYALRQHPKISGATRRKVLQAAESLGYAPNTRVSNLMAYIRRSKHHQFSEKIAFVWMRTPRDVAERDPFLKLVYEGARARAELAGFGLEQFYTDERGMTDKRLEQILRTRGITGVVFSPIMDCDAVVSLDWDWSGFSAAVIGNITWQPELNHAGHHHFYGMRIALENLARLGGTRPAAIINAAPNTRAKRAWEAAFVTHYPAAAHARSYLRLPNSEGDRAELAAWLEESAPDALILSAAELLEAPGLRAVCRRLGLRTAVLYWTEQGRLPGVDQCYDRIAAHAIDLVISQLNANELGAPDLPRMILFPGRWVD